MGERQNGTEAATLATMGSSAQACAWYIRRKFAGLSQSDVCLATGISRARYSHIEHEELEPTETERQKIDGALLPLPRAVVEELLKVTCP